MADVKFRFARNGYIGLVPEEVGKIMEARKEGSIVRTASNEKDSKTKGNKGK